MKFRRIRQLTMNCKTLNFKTLHISTILYISLNVPYSTIAQLDKTQKEFIWRNGYPKQKNASIWNDYEKDGIWESFKNTFFTEHVRETTVIHAHHFVMSFCYTLLCLPT